MTKTADCGASVWAALRAGMALLAAMLSCDLTAAELTDRLLTRVDAYRHDGRADIVIGLSQGLRYVSHTLDVSGRVLEVRLSVETAAGSGTSDGANTLRWAETGGADRIPLELISANLNGSIPSVILRFAQTVDVREVNANPDDRTLTVSILRPKAVTEAVTGVATGMEARAGIFVINLTSTTAETVIDPKQRAALDPGMHIYQVKSRINEVLRYRQRIGFYRSAAEAQAALPEVKRVYPDAWISEISDVEREAVVSSGPVLDLSTVVVRADVGQAVAPTRLDRVIELMEDARSAATAGDLTRAATIYERVSAYAIKPMQQDARELLGVARDKAGQAAQAKAAYEAYLQAYPTGDGADRVRQRLTALVAPPIRVDARAGHTLEQSSAAQWDVFGSFYQFYRYDQFQVNSEATQTTLSLLSTDLDVNGRRRSETLDLRLRLSGRYDYDFLDSADNQFRASMAYLDLATRDQIHSARIGRQTRTSGGALGRFDGIYYGYRTTPHSRVNVLAGTPVASTADSFSTDRVLYGLNVDIGPIAEHWNFNVYGVNQTADANVDRRAVGTELRYFNDGVSLFGLFDYDVYFNEPNIAYLIGSGNLGDATTVSVIADRRRSPLLSVSNALIGQVGATLADLRQIYSEAELKQLALDRSSISTSYTASLSQAISTRFRISGDLTSAELASTPASGGVDAIPGAGPDWYYNLQLIGSDLLGDGDLAILGLRYTDTTTYQGMATSANYRRRLFDQLDVNPRLRVERRSTDSGRTQWIYGPSVRVSWIGRRPWTIEAELAAELSNEQFLDTTDKTKLYYGYLGYRYDF
jgi:hypothetical protein